MLKPIAILAVGAVGVGVCAAGDRIGRAHAAGDDAIVTVPNLVFLSYEQAQAAAKSAGVTRPIAEDNNTLCGSVVDGRIVERGHVCSQSPAPGTRQGARLLVTVRTQTEDQQHGNVGQANEWHLMPDVAGMTQDEAMAKIREAGFTDAAAIQIGNTSERSCPIRRVCRTTPTRSSAACRSR